MWFKVKLHQQTNNIQMQLTQNETDGRSKTIIMKVIYTKITCVSNQIYCTQFTNDNSKTIQFYKSRRKTCKKVDKKKDVQIHDI